MSIRLHPEGHQAVTAMPSDGFTGWQLDDPPCALERAHMPVRRDESPDGWRVFRRSIFSVTPDALLASAVFEVRPSADAPARPGRLPRYDMVAAVEFRRWGDWAIVDRWTSPDAPSTSLSAIAFSPDGRWMAVAGSSPSLLLVDRPTGAVTGGVAIDVDSITGLAFDGSGRYLSAMCASQGGGYASIWAVERGRLTGLHDGMTGPAETGRPPSLPDPLADAYSLAAFSSDGKTLAMYASTEWIGAWGGLLVFNVADGSLRWRKRIKAELLDTELLDTELLGTGGPEGEYPSDVAFSADDRYVFCGSPVGRLLAFDAATGELAGSLALSADPVWSFAAAPDGSALWAMADGRPVRVAPTPEAW
jgi:WD40 repeat protein